MLHFLLLLFSSIKTGKSFDAWEVLSADLTCCPQHVTALECSLEGASDCSWIGDSDDPFKIALAAYDGVNCVGEAYLACKMAAGDVNACCSPGCKGIQPPGDPEDPSHPATGVIPECFQLPPVTVEKCELGTNYAFEGLPCQVSGDPHFQLWNGATHSFQGQPMTTNTLGRYQNQFYYISRCSDVDSRLMPFQVIGTHYAWGNSGLSGVDYLTLELEDVHQTFYIYISTSIAAWARAWKKGVSPNYDETYINGKTMLLEKDVEHIIGESFSFRYIQKHDTSIDATLTYLNPDESSSYNNNGGSFTFSMRTQMNPETDAIYGHTRYRLHNLYMTLDQEFKCAACGLCGNFQDMDTGHDIRELETCSGDYINYRQGAQLRSTPEAFDLYGWTYEYTFFNKYCGTPYDVTDNYGDMRTKRPCSLNIKEAVIAKCDAVKEEHASCCNEVIGKRNCAVLTRDCYMDACVIATAMGESEESINEAVASVLGETIEHLCTIPDITEQSDEGNLQHQQYMGCYIDDETNRAFEQEASTTIANKNIAQCIDLCAGYTYMGLQYSTHCYCSDDWASISQYGVADQEVCPPGGTYCHMKDINCVYRISTIADNDKYKKKQFMSRILVEEEEEEEKKKELEILALDNNVVVMERNAKIATSFASTVKNSYILIGAVGGVVALAGLAGYYYAKCKNKDGKYVLIQ